MMKSLALPRCFEQLPDDHPHQGSAGPDDKKPDQAMVEEHSAMVAAVAVHSVGSPAVLEVAEESFPGTVEPERSLAGLSLPVEQHLPEPEERESPGSVLEP
jgi:hypothetical protein